MIESLEALSLPSFLAVIAFALSMAAAAISDLLTLKIPNMLNYGLALAFFLFAIPSGLSWGLIGLHLGSAAIVLGCGMFMFAFRLIGGGDAKMAVACALWLGMSELLSFFIHFSLAGGALALFFLILRMIPKPQVFAKIVWINRLWKRDGGIPYGIAIAIGALVSLPDSVWLRPLHSSSAGW